MVNLVPENIKGKTVLIAALDWGMGHTTRCVSIVRDLLLQGNQVTFAGNKKQLTFIRRDFPKINTVELNGYNISFNSKKNTYTQLLGQLLKFKKSVKDEKTWLQNYVRANQVDYIISDNRYGFYHPDISSIFITHQLQLQVPYFKKRANKIIRKYIEYFDYCWIPDVETNRYAGKLSSGSLSIPIHYLGLLNRFQKHEAEKEYGALIILSGPEPERTNFLNYIVNKVELIAEGDIAFVGADLGDEFDSFPNPTSKELELLIARSSKVISRAGYTTIMEMVGLEKEAMLFPAKGQYEQEYLAEIDYPTITFYDKL